MFIYMVIFAFKKNYSSWRIKNRLKTARIEASNKLAEYCSSPGER